jgi:hypothetical protein
LLEAALDPSEGVDYVGKPEGWGLEMREKFTAEDYHKPSDKVKPYWDLRGAVEHLQLLGETATASQMRKPTQPGRLGRNSKGRGKRC